FADAKFRGGFGAPLLRSSLQTSGAIEVQPNFPLRSVTRPAMIASLFGSCPSGHGFATRFLQTLFRSYALALH
ncbi:MAG: hypothetical protein ACYSUB_20425, partial [Planctomycetota bacterium]